MKLIGWIFCSGILATTLAVQASPVVNLGHYYVVAGYTQSASLTVSDAGNAAAEDIEGMKFTLQIAAGTDSTPAISSADFLTSSIWTGHVSADDVLPAGGGTLAQFKSYSLLTDSSGDFVNANGTLATINFSGANAAPGDYSLKLVGTKSPSTDSTFANGVGNPVPAIFGSGTLTVVAPLDINGDGHVNVADVSALMGALTNLSSYESSKHLTPTQLLQVADANGDGKVSNADIQSLVALLANHGGTISGSGVLSAVPEPSSIVLMLLAAAAFVLMHWRYRQRFIPQ